MTKATTVRFTDEMFARLDQASARTGMPVNSIVIAACLEWMERHTPSPMEPRSGVELPTTEGMRMTVPPRWATIRRAVEQAVWKPPSTLDPFGQFTSRAQQLLTVAQIEALAAGLSYLGTVHMVLGAYG